MHRVLVPRPIICPREGSPASQARKPPHPEVVVFMRLKVGCSREIPPTEFAMVLCLFDDRPVDLDESRQVARLVRMVLLLMSLSILVGQETEVDHVAAFHTAREGPVVPSQMLVQLGSRPKAFIEIITCEAIALDEVGSVQFDDMIGGSRRPRGPGRFEVLQDFADLGEGFGQFLDADCAARLEVCLLVLEDVAPDKKQIVVEGLLISEVGAEPCGIVFGVAVLLLRWPCVLGSLWLGEKSRPVKLDKFGQGLGNSSATV